MCYNLCFEVWLSLVERFVRDEEAAGSNPVTSTNGYPGIIMVSGYFCVLSTEYSQKSSCFWYAS